MAKRASPGQQASVTDISACVSTSDVPRPRKEASFREWMVDNQIGISLTVLAMLTAVHNLYPSLSTYTAPFFQLSYYQPSKGTYIQGWDDVYFVFSSILAFTAIRAAAIGWAFVPFARRSGLKKKAALRFGEQAWLFSYYTFFWSIGMYIWTNSYYWMDFKAIWSRWPARDMSGLTKWYLLVQLGFWVQQIVVINIEEKRKDHYQMFSHHIITSSLLLTAYLYSFYNVSNVVLCLMDVVDFMLPTAKMLKYFKYERSCTAAFVVFLVTWLISRHVIYLTLCWSIYYSIPDVMPYGCYSGTTTERLSPNGYPNRFGHLFLPFFDLDGPICINPTTKVMFMSYLLAIQTLSLVWFGMILRVAVGVLRTGNAEDTRSDDEGEAETQTTDKTGSNGAAVIGDASSSEWRTHGAPSVRPRGRDRKELLGRIGCEKPTS